MYQMMYQIEKKEDFFLETRINFKHLLCLVNHNEARLL